jgi:ParB family transcriptional regulator, chromosome partitioning protein
METDKLKKRELVEVPLSDISKDKNQPRKYFDKDAMNDLANSIGKHGVLQPIILRKSSTGGSIIVAGERRYQASTKLGLETIPAIYISENTAEIAIVENLLREDLTPVEEAEALDALKSEHKYTNKALGEIIGKAENTISEMLSLMKLPVEIRDECRERPKYSRSMLLAVTKKNKIKAMVHAFHDFKENGWSRDEFRRQQRSDKGKTRNKYDQVNFEDDTFDPDSADFTRPSYNPPEPKYATMGNKDDRDESAEWYTPESLLRYIYHMFDNHIDLDPCSNKDSMNKPNIVAKQHFTKSMDGVRSDRIWPGKIYVNPPFYNGLCLAFVEKGIEQIEAGNLDEIIYLMPSNCGTRWSSTLLNYGFDVCFLEKQQKFIHSTKENLIKSPWGSILYYHGSNSAKFNQIFSEIGHVYKKG